MPLLLGGLVAGGIGYAVAELNFFGGSENPALSRLQTQLDEQSQKIATLEQVEPQMPEIDLSAVDEMGETVSAVQASLDGLQTTLAAIDDRLTVLEKQPVTGGTTETAIAAFERELAGMQASVTAQRAEIETLLDDALSVEQATQATAKTTAARAALIGVKSAIDAGQPFEAELATLAETLEEPIPDALADVAPNGAPTLVSLQLDFPNAARAALARSRAAGEETGEDGFGGFLRRQLGARSVSPREGSDPDAVLSRAEIAVKEGRLSDALSELDALPESGKTAMSDWLSGANARSSALAATDQLADQLAAN